MAYKKTRRYKTSVTLTPAMKEILHRGYNACNLTRPKLAEKAGIGLALVYKIIATDGKHVNRELFCNLLDVIAPYLTPEEVALLPRRRGRPRDNPRLSISQAAQNAKVTTTQQKPSQAPVAARTPSVYSVPLVTSDDLVPYNFAIEPILEYVARTSKTNYSIHVKSTKVFAVNNMSPSSIPGLPVGGVIIVSGAGYPTSGQYVIARVLGQEKLVVAHFSLKQNIIQLSPMNDCTTLLTIDRRTEAHRIQWMFPLIQYVFPSLRQISTANSEAIANHS